MSSVSTERSKIAHAIRVLAIPILLGWIALTVVTNVFVPSLEKVGEAHTVSMNAHDAPAFIAMQRIGANFQEFDSDSNAMVILEGDKPLGADAHHYYDELIKRFEAEVHVEHVADFWSDPLTAAGAQSNDGKAAYVQLYLRGNMGETIANESIAAVRDIIEKTPPPQGVKAYVTGGAAMNSDQRVAGDKGAAKATLVTLVVIALMLLFVYRSIVTTILILLMVFFELGASRGIVAFLGNSGVIGLSTFATSLLTLIAIAAGTDYAIFLIGRYQEARGAGEDRETAYYTMFHGTAHVVLGSGLTIAGAMLCLRFTRLPWFQTMAVPCAVGILVAVIAALTLGPAVIAIGSRFGLFEPKRAISSRGWRRIGVVVVRWPGPILVATCALALIGLLALPGYKTDYDGRHFMPDDTPSNIGYAVADRHFDAARMNPELMMVESDHDLRNSADFLVIDKIAKAVFRVPGIARVQTITRPDGKPIEHTTIPFLLSMQGTTNQLNQKYNQDRMADMLVQADEMQTTIDTLTQMSNLTQEMASVTHSMVAKTKNMTVDIAELRDHIADFDDFFRPHAQLPLLGTALLRHPAVLVGAVDFRHPRRYRHDDRRHPATRARSGAPRRAHAGVGRVDACADRDHEDDEVDDADDVRHPKGHAGSAGRAAGEFECDGRRIRRVDERRFVLPAPRGLRQRRLQTRYGQLHFTRRQVGALHHRA